MLAVQLRFQPIREPRAARKYADQLRIKRDAGGHLRFQVGEERFGVG